jgi:hypothetical protein
MAVLCRFVLAVNVAGIAPLGIAPRLHALAADLFFSEYISPRGEKHSAKLIATLDTNLATDDEPQPTTTARRGEYRARKVQTAHLTPRAR